MNKYEIMLLIKTTIDEKAVKESVDNLKSIITDMNGKINDFREIGQKALAYPVEKHLSGYYYVLTCAAEASVIAEFERKAKIDENVLRYLVIKLDEE